MNIETIREHWHSKDLLGWDCLDIAEEQFNLAQSISSQEASLNAAFLSAREDMYKGSDSLAKAKAKALVGTSKTTYEYEFEALSNLLNLVTSRMAQLGTNTSSTQSPLRHADASSEESLS